MSKIGIGKLFCTNSADDANTEIKGFSDGYVSDFIFYGDSTEFTQASLREDKQPLFIFFFRVQVSEPELWSAQGPYKAQVLFEC